MTSVEILQYFILVNLHLLDDAVLGYDTTRPVGGYLHFIILEVSSDMSYLVGMFIL
jgi:hypothetical protein